MSTHKWDTLIHFWDTRRDVKGFTFKLLSISILTLGLSKVIAAKPMPKKCRIAINKTPIP